MASASRLVPPSSLKVAQASNMVCQEPVATAHHRSAWVYAAWPRAPLKFRAQKDRSSSRWFSGSSSRSMASESVMPSISATSGLVRRRPRQGEVAPCVGQKRLIRRVKQLEYLVGMPFMPLTVHVPVGLGEFGSGTGAMPYRPISAHT